VHRKEEIKTEKGRKAGFSDKLKKGKEI